MAKKKKRTNKKKSNAPKKLEFADGIAQEIVAVLLIIIAVILLVAGFGLGGQLPTRMFNGLRTLVGFGAYVLPLILILIAVRIFADEEHRTPWVLVLGSGIILSSFSGLLHLFYMADEPRQAATTGIGGGLLGYGLDNLLMSLFNQATAAIFLMGLFIIGLLIASQVTIQRVVQFISEWRDMRKTGKDNGDGASELSRESATATERHSPTLNTNVPIEKPAERKERVNKLAKQKAEEDQALTMSADPEWNFPDVKLLSDKQEKADAGDWRGNAEIIRQTLEDFKVPVQMGDINVGPRVTQYTLMPESGVRLTKITALEQNIALNLAATSIRIEAPIPGKRAVGIEVPNQKSANVRLRSILESAPWKKAHSSLTFVIGQDISGQPTVAELEKMPHLLIAGATGSGKSVMINTFLASLLYRNSPSEMKLILVDPKQVELTPYNDLPHLLTPVIIDPEKCISALKWSVAEMERRYSMLAEAGKRNIEDYNKLKNQDHMPYIVIVIDELADLMMVAARDVESLIVRLAQKARATGIHLTLATQRPSVDVITGLIKANIPARIAFSVTSQIDSRTILDQGGAEKLLGSGDMLYSSPTAPKPIRLQGAFVSDKELNMITDHIKMERAPDYNDDIISQPVQIGGKSGGIVPDADASDDSLYNDAIKVVIEAKKASASMLQRRLRVGYGRAARMIETMEEQGIIGPADGSRPREVLVSSIEDMDNDGEAEL